VPRPLILVTPHTENEGTELPDAGISLSNRYAEAIAHSGGMPLVLPCSTDARMVREAISRADGVMLSGGEDIATNLYSHEMSPEILATITPAVGDRDLFETTVIHEVFRQSKPLMAICRGHQMINVALGGSLLGDIGLQRPCALAHNRQPERFEPVHDVVLEPDSLLAHLAGTTHLRVNSTHHQAVHTIAPPLRPAGRSPDGIVEVLELAPDHAETLPFFLAVQFHPERLYDRYPEHARIFTAFVQACGSHGPQGDSA
jgi:putative glutamine amidotransferase